MSTKSATATAILNSSPTTMTRRQMKLRQMQEEQQQQPEPVKKVAPAVVEKPVVVAAVEKGKRGRKPSAATLAKRAAAEAVAATPTTTTTNSVANNKTMDHPDQSDDEKVKNEIKDTEEEIVVRRAAEKPAAPARRRHNNRNNTNNDSSMLDDDDDDDDDNDDDDDDDVSDVDEIEETAEATEALKEIRHVAKKSTSNGGQNGHHSDMDDEDDEDEYTDDDGGMDESRGGRGGGGGGPNDTTGGGGGGGNQMDSSMEHLKENNDENEMSSMLITDSSFNASAPAGAGSGVTPTAPKSGYKKKEDHEKLRRRLPVSVKELIDYHSSNGKSIKEIVSKVNVVCRQDEKVSYGYVQKYLYRKKLEATTAKKARYYRKKYGFVYRRMRRKPVLTDAHRAARIQWCQAYMSDHFDQDIFIGKTSLKPFLASLNQLKGQPPDPTQPPRQQTTLHLWGAISRKGASPLQIFDGGLTTAMYLEILLENVVPFIAENFPNGHRFHQDNNPKHSAKLSQEFLESTGINWVKSPPRSHDLNPIELVWTDLIQNVSKRLPKTIGQVVIAVKDYWKTLTPEKCSEFIDKLVDIVPKVYEKQGEWVSLT